MMDLNRIVPGWEQVGSVTPAVCPEDLGDGSFTASLATVGNSVTPGEELNLILARMEFTPDEATAAAFALSACEHPAGRHRPKSQALPNWRILCRGCTGLRNGTSAQASELRGVIVAVDLSR